MNVPTKKNVTTGIDPMYSGETLDRKDPKGLYPSTPYQKVLDYHVAEILLSTIVLAVIALLRMYH
jgi:hypothetical protein